MKKRYNINLNIIIKSEFEVKITEEKKKNLGVKVNCSAVTERLMRLYTQKGESLFENLI